ncbi:prolyl oligopeptidase-like protein [Xylariaceae sp. FL0804]|nr:prolyl oligopeptidase-like protein [Xylariaceae sp. FL0804]
MAACRALRLGLPTLRAAPSRAYSSSSQRVPLAFDHHGPPQPDDRDRQGGPPILFLHGLFGSKKNNRSVCKVLARDLRRHVYALDLRNHGESPHAPRHDYPAMADDVAGFIEDHGLAPPTLIGHSMGAKTAMALSLGQPEMVHDLVSVDNAPVDATLSTNFAQYVRGMQRIEEAGVTKQSEADEILQEYEKELPIRQFLLGNLHRPPPSPSSSPSSSSSSSSPSQQPLRFRVPLGVLARSLGHMGDFPFRDPAAARFGRPALFVRGARSPYVPDDVVPLIGRFFPRFRLEDVDAGHWLISEKPDDFLRIVKEFLTREE